MQQIPNLRLLDFVVPGRPHLDFVLIAPIKAVGDDAMISRQLSREHIRLHRPRDARKARHQRRSVATARQPRHVGHRG
jgi:hypothetical protein